MAKKPWKKPELILFVRGKVQENVLRVCKAAVPFPNPCVPAHGNPSHQIGKS